MVCQRVESGDTYGEPQIRIFGKYEVQIDCRIRHDVYHHLIDVYTMILEVETS